MSRVGFAPLIVPAAVLWPIASMPGTHQNACEVFATRQKALRDPALVWVAIASFTPEIAGIQTCELISKKGLGHATRHRVPLGRINTPEADSIVTHPERVTVRYADRFRTGRIASQNPRHQHRRKRRHKTIRYPSSHSERFHPKTLSRKFNNV